MLSKIFSRNNMNNTCPYHLGAGRHLVQQSSDYDLRHRSNTNLTSSVTHLSGLAGKKYHYRYSILWLALCCIRYVSYF